MGKCDSACSYLCFLFTCHLSIFLEALSLFVLLYTPVDIRDRLAVEVKGIVGCLCPLHGCFAQEPVPCL